MLVVIAMVPELTNEKTTSMKMILICTVPMIKKVENNKQKVRVMKSL